MIKISPPASLPLIAEVPTAPANSISPAIKLLDASAAAVDKDQLHVQSVLLKQTGFFGNPGCLEWLPPASPKYQAKRIFSSARADASSTNDSAAKIKATMARFKENLLAIKTSF